MRGQPKSSRRPASEMVGLPWTDLAACREVDPDRWFPDLLDPGKVLHLQKICGTCEVQDQCLQAGIDEPYGVWGGMTPDQRRRLRT